MTSRVVLPPSHNIFSFHDCDRESRSRTCAGTSRSRPLSIETLTFARSRCKALCTLVRPVVSQGLPEKSKVRWWTSPWYLAQDHIHIHCKNIAHPVQTPQSYIYNIPVLTIVGTLSETLRQAPSLSTATQASPPIVILTGLFEAYSRSSVYLDFIASR